MDPISLCVHMVEGVRKLSRASYKDTNLIYEGSNPHDLSFPKSPSVNTLEIRLRDMNFGERQIFSL